MLAVHKYISLVAAWKVPVLLGCALVMAVILDKTPLQGGQEIAMVYSAAWVTGVLMLMWKCIAYIAAPGKGEVAGDVVESLLSWCVCYMLALCVIKVRGTAVAQLVDWLQINYLVFTCAGMGFAMIVVADKFANLANRALGKFRK